jgi:hypothetical protein
LSHDARKDFADRIIAFGDTIETKGLFIEFPVLSLSTADEPQFVNMIATRDFDDGHASPESFMSYLDGNGIATFKNLSKDTTLVAPTPQPQTDAYHILSFTRTAPEERSIALWKAVADAVIAQFNALSLAKAYTCPLMELECHGCMFEYASRQSIMYQIINKYYSNTYIYIYMVK